MIQEGNEAVTKCDALKLRAKDGKMRYTDMLDTKNIFRLNKLNFFLHFVVKK